MNTYLIKKKIKKKEKVFLFYIQNENQETRLCGNERLKVDFFEVCSVERTFVFVGVAVEEDEEGEGDNEGFLTLISFIIVWVNGDDGDGETDKGIGDGRDGIENGDGIPNVPWEGENNEDVKGSIVISSFVNVWRDIIEDVSGEKSSRVLIDGDWNNDGS